MTEFFTPESIRTIREMELEMERNQAMLEAYDPYADFDDDFYDEEDEGQEWIAEDAGMEGYLFGWDS